MKKALIVGITALLVLCLCAGAGAADSNVGSGTLTVKLTMNVPGTYVTDMYGNSEYVSGTVYQASYYTGSQFPPKSGYFTVDKSGYEAQSVFLSGSELPNSNMDVFVTKQVNLREVPYGTLLISSDPTDASVQVDGSFVGNSPVSVSVPAGSHSVTVSKSGYTTSSTTARVNSGQTTSVSVSLGSTYGYISISCDPAGASVTLDGSYIGTAPITVKASAGKHSVSMSKSGYGTFSSSVNVRAGETSTVFGVLPPSKTAGYFSIASTPTGASVYIDGEYIGKTPYSSTGIAYLSAGPYSTSRTYNVQLQLEGYQTYTTTAVPSSDSVVIINPVLAQKQATTGSIHVTSSPAGASVTIDGIYYGTSPITVPNLAQGSHTVKVSAAGYVDSVQTINVNAGQNVEYPVTLYTPSPAPSPAPVLGILAGLAAAGLFAVLRRRE